MDILIVVDMQNDFITGALGSPAAESIVDGVRERIEGFSGKVIFTRDTHTLEYLDTQEGRRLPVTHCVKDTEGWQIAAALPIPEGSIVIDKEGFGSKELMTLLQELDGEERVSKIELLGLCTDICVISNAFIAKAALPEAEISVNARLSRGVSEESHDMALRAMRACQIDIIE